MSKDPAFLFYPNDWLGGTMTLTRYQKGCYMDLLMAQFNSGPLSLETIKTLLGTDHAVWAVLRAKFKQDADGRFFNERLATEMCKRKVFTASRLKNLKKENPHMAPHMGAHMGTHMENENRNENEDRDRNENTTKPGKKKKYRSNILLSTEEFDKLCTDYGPDATNTAIDYLESYKQEKNYTTKSDYLSIRRWVMEAANKPTHYAHKQALSPAHDYILATDGTKIYAKDIDFTKLG